MILLKNAHYWRRIGLFMMRYFFDQTRQGMFTPLLTQAVLNIIENVFSQTKWHEDSVVNVTADGVVYIAIYLYVLLNV
jgi:hypothetical protein